MEVKLRMFRVAVLACVVSVCGFAVPASAHVCSPACNGSACMVCREGVCVYDCDDWDLCESCVEGSCTSRCTGGCQTCDNSFCEDDESKCPGECERCSDGDCTNYEILCHGCEDCDASGNCVDDGVTCERCKTCNRAGNCEDDCEASEYCCGDYPSAEICCDNSRVCCSNVDPQVGLFYSCELPCWEEVDDSTSCTNEDEKCDGCRQVLPPTCGTYRDYTGLVTKDCYAGCAWEDWDTTIEICYEVKTCVNIPYGNRLCVECAGQNVCLPITIPNPPGGDCETYGECVVKIVCDYATICQQCESDIPPPLSTVVSTVYKSTCSCR